MNRTIIALLSVIAVLGVVALGTFEPKVRGAGVTTPQPGGGCATCHPKLSQNVPDGHFKATLNEVKYCLACHAQPGAATAFAWTVHETHYATLGQAAQCLMCHQIDANGNFRVIGVEGDTGTKATPDLVAKAQPYYLSWAASDRLDHKHGRHSVTCSACHEVAFQETAVKKEKCFACHGSYVQITQRAPIHFDAMSPHFAGEPVECNACHKPHGKSVLVCNQCHNFDDQVP